MDLPQEVDDFIKESIDHTLGLPVSAHTLELKLRCSEESRRRLREQYSLLLDKLKEKDQALERSRTEASVNALAIRKLVEENEKLKEECKHLVGQRNQLEEECRLYDKDREALMDEIDKMAEEVDLLSEENKVLKAANKQYRKQKCSSKMSSSPVQGAARQPLSPLDCNSLDSRLGKKQ